MDNMYTRTQLADICQVSKKTIRTYLSKFDIPPSKVQRTAKNLPIYYYSQQNLQRLQREIGAKRRGHKKCYICKQYFPQSQMQGTRCITCYVKKYLNPIIYGKHCWNKVVCSRTVQIAIEILQAIIPSSR